MGSEPHSALSVVFVLLLAGTMTVVAVAVAPEPTAQTAQAGNAAGPTTISVSATGDAQSEPDRTGLMLASRTPAEDPQTATERLAANVS